MKINLKETLEFFDERKPENKGQPTSVIGVIGEDLNASLFKHYMEGEGYDVNTLDNCVTTGSKKGPRLDRWVLASKAGERVMYQTEIKNWCGWAIGGYNLSLEAGSEEMRAVLSHTWNRQMHRDFTLKKYPNHITKVMVPMKIPTEYKEMDILVEPLLIYWMPITNNTENPSCFFSVSKKDLPGIGETPFNKLNFFSASLYLRSLWKDGKTKVELEMPNVEKRISALDNIINK
jgi:hypothetical protein